MRAHAKRARQRRPDRGTVLIVSMWIVLVLAGLALVFARAMRVEAIATANYLAGLQAEAAARGALEALIAKVDGAQGEVPDLSELPCEQVQVGDAYYWLLSPDLSDDRTWRFGVIDEASRINLNSASVDMLLKLPGMTAELAAAIVDWRDGDAEITPGGAESEYYLLLSPPYYCKDAPLESVEEVLLVKGATPELLWGEDTNRNGILDENENDGDATEPLDDGDGTLDRGFGPYVTVYSVEPNTSASGEQRININEPGSAALSDLLRQVVPEDRFFQVMDRVRRGRPYANVLDFCFRSGLTQEEFAQIADRLTASDQELAVGLVNVNTAPREVLLCLPELDESDVDALISARAGSGVDLSNIAWVAGALSQEKAVAIGQFITVRSFQFSADIVSVSADGRAFRRYRAVVDARQSPPRVLCWKDLTHLGWPLDPEILTSLRSGAGLSDRILRIYQE